MTALRLKPSPGTARAVAVVLGATLLGLFFGLAAAFLPWLLVLLLVLVPTALLASAVIPWVGLLLAMALVFEALPNAFVPALPLAGGRLQGYDLLLLYLGALYLLLLVIKGTFRPLVDLGPFRWPLAYLFLMTAVSLAYGIWFRGNEFALTEARTVLAWLILPLAVAFMPGEKGLKRLFITALAFGVVIALFVSIQSAFDVRIMSVSRIESLDRQNYDITRSIAGGGVYLIVFALFYFLNALIDKPSRFWWLLPLTALVLMGLAVQFGRGVWLASAVGLLVSAFIHRGFVGAGRVVLIGGLLMSMLVAGLSVVRPRAADALADRVLGIGAEIRTGSSFAWRQVENAEAIRAISERPVLGVGQGGEYKRAISSAGSFAIDTWYIHNSYLYFPLKMGIFAALIPFAFIGVFVYLARDIMRRRPPIEDKAFLGALFGAFTVPVLTSYTQPEWSAVQGIAAFSMFMAMLILYRQRLIGNESFK